VLTFGANENEIGRTEIRLNACLIKCSATISGDVEPDDRSLTPAPAQLNNLLQSGNRMLKTRSASGSGQLRNH
jgi:hypothetical protein